MELAAQVQADATLGPRLAMFRDYQETYGEEGRLKIDQILRKVCGLQLPKETATVGTKMSHFAVPVPPPRAPEMQYGAAARDAQDRPGLAEPARESKKRSIYQMTQSNGRKTDPMVAQMQESFSKLALKNRD